MKNKRMNQSTKESDEEKLKIESFNCPISDSESYLLWGCANHTLLFSLFNKTNERRNPSSGNIFTYAGCLGYRCCCYCHRRRRPSNLKCKPFLIRCN